jgi:hypothetical protein
MTGTPETITEDEIVAEMTAAAERAKAVPSRWRRGTAEVEAMQLTHESGPQVWEWADSKPTYGTDKFVDGLAVYTRAGRVRASFGDWIVRDARGAFTVWIDGTFRGHHEQEGGSDD